MSYEFKLHGANEGKGDIAVIRLLFNLQSKTYSLLLVRFRPLLRRDVFGLEVSAAVSGSM